MVFLFALPFPVLVALYLGFRAGLARSAGVSGILAGSGRGCCLGFQRGFPVALPLDHLTCPSSLARNSSLRRDLDRRNWRCLVAGFGDLLCHYGAKNPAQRIRAQGKSWTGASGWQIEPLYRSKVRHPLKELLDAGQN